MPSPSLPAPFVFGLGMLAGALALPLTACLQGLGLHRGTTPDGRPSVELCAEMAKAQSSATAVASAAPTATADAGAGDEEVDGGVLRHAR